MKQERLVFRAPTKGIVVSAVEILPTNISSDRLRGMLDRANRPITRVVIVLAAVHGLRPTDIMRARLADLDLSAGRLIIHRVTGKHIVYLDELSTRSSRPGCGTDANGGRSQPTRTCWSAAEPPWTSGNRAPAWRPCAPWSSHSESHRPHYGQTRILDEARQTADPIHLMRLFGICDSRR